MKITRSLTLFLVCLTALAVSAEAQKTTTKKPVRRTTPTSTKTSSTLPPLEVRAARVKVSNQLYNVSAFLQRLGPISQNIEALDNDARTKKIKKESIDQNEASKQKVVTALRTLRDGLVSLESEFRTKPDLKKYLPTIQGISDLAGQSIDSAMAGKFVASNAPLRTVQQKLNDTLTAMPNAEL